MRLAGLGFRHTGLGHLDRQHFANLAEAGAAIARSAKYYNYHRLGRLGLAQPLA